MGPFTGKKGMVFGIANDRSIAWAIGPAESRTQIAEAGRSSGGESRHFLRRD